MALAEGSLSEGDRPRLSQRSWFPALLAAAIGLGVVALLVVLWFGLAQREKGTVGVSAVPLRQAPEFSLGLFNGSTLTLREALASGKPLVLNFWASWCVPCADEAPLLEATWRREKDRATFVGVDVQDFDPDALAFIQKYGITYPNGSGEAGAISVAYGMRGVPETYFIAPDGRIVRKWSGPLTAAGLDQFLLELYRGGGGNTTGR